MNETLIFFQIVPLAFSTLIPVSFPGVKLPQKLLFWLGVKLHCCITFHLLHICKFETNIRNEENALRKWTVLCMYNPVFLQEHLILRVLRLILYFFKLLQTLDRLIDWLIDFNGMSSYSEILWQELKNHRIMLIVHTYSHFLCTCFLISYFFAHDPIKYE